VLTGHEDSRRQQQRRRLPADGAPGWGSDDTMLRTLVDVDPTDAATPVGSSAIPA
jgi:hypothetical protein